jgi:hypothetical protein
MNAQTMVEVVVFALMKAIPKSYIGCGRLVRSDGSLVGDAGL